MPKSGADGRHDYFLVQAFLQVAALVHFLACLVQAFLQSLQLPLQSLQSLHFLLFLQFFLQSLQSLPLQSFLSVQHAFWAHSVFCLQHFLTGVCAFIESENIATRAITIIFFISVVVF